ncbi:MAG: CPXCG motif-containing cysteine-rich protein [Verrucomicrobiota bacterium]|jgi:hypothetical protein
MMQESGSVQCPFCGQRFDLAIETSQAEQQFIVDCEVCCRPLRVSVTCEAGEILDLRAEAD